MFFRNTFYRSSLKFIFCKQFMRNWCEPFSNRGYFSVSWGLSVPDKLANYCSWWVSSWQRDTIMEHQIWRIKYDEGCDGKTFNLFCKAEWIFSNWKIFNGWILMAEWIRYTSYEISFKNIVVHVPRILLFLCSYIIR